MLSALLQFRGSRGRSVFRGIVSLIQLPLPSLILFFLVVKVTKDLLQVCGHVVGFFGRAVISLNVLWGWESNFFYLQ